MEELEEQWRSEANDRLSEFNTLEELVSLLDQVLLGQVRLLRLSRDLRSHVTTRSEDNDLNEWIHQAEQSVRVRNQEGIRNCHAPNLTSGSPSAIETVGECDGKMEIAILEHKRAFARLDSFRKHKGQVAIQSELVNEDSLPSVSLPVPFEAAKNIVEKRREDAWMLEEFSEQKEVLGTAPDLEVVPWGSLAPRQRTISEKSKSVGIAPEEKRLRVALLEMNRNVGGEENKWPKKRTPMTTESEKNQQRTSLPETEKRVELRVVVLGWISLPIPRSITSWAVTEPNPPRKSSPESEKTGAWTLEASPEIQSLKAKSRGRLAKRLMVGRSSFALKPYQVRPKPNSLKCTSALAHKSNINPMGQFDLLTSSWAQSFQSLHGFDQVVVMAQLNKKMGHFIFKGVQLGMSYPKYYIHNHETRDGKEHLKVTFLLINGEGCHVIGGKNKIPLVDEKFNLGALIVPFKYWVFDRGRQTRLQPTKDASRTRQNTTLLTWFFDRGRIQHGALDLSEFINHLEDKVKLGRPVMLGLRISVVF